MALFQKSVLNKFIKSQDAAKIEAAYKKFCDTFLQPDRQVEIRSMKEEEYQDGFLDDLFVNILGYIKRPNAGFNLVREKKNEADSKKADGAILKNDMPLAVIELKGTDTTDLDKVTNQGFGYKNNHKECVYVVISNFEKLRFYIHHAVDYIEFNLFTLSKEDFTTLWLCLHSDNLLANIPAKIKAESVVKEEDITKSLYKDYSSFKQELWQSIVNLNPEGDPLVFYKKTQKLIDRFLFIFFAEDAGLLPPNSISRMVDRWQMLKDEDAYKPLYDIFKQYFGYINTGRSGKTPQDEIFAYNGGLFVEDKILDEILVNDDVLLKHTLKLTVYDFSSEVDVNILGHIFENSLNDIEAVTAELEGKEIDKSKTKRKKDGVFYTPKYITKYIVDNTVGKLCDEKKVELDIIDEEYAKGRTNRKKETLKKLDENLQAYRNWLLHITICDPACGSGAFLNQALEYLMEEHRYIDELESQLLGAGFTFPGVENHILENNIFGVDINEESIEIAKLSLWLRTAQRGRKLTSLNNNIKCGNSLIDDPSVAGEKAFNWQNEFPTVFEKGGFDVVIGNPPYVSSKGENFNKIEKEYYYKNYTCSSYQIDLYLLFNEKSVSLVKPCFGLIAFIEPNGWLNNLFLIDVRKFLLTNLYFQEIVDTPIGVFKDATVDTVIIIWRNQKEANKSINISGISNNTIEFRKTVNQYDFLKDDKLLVNIHSSASINLILSKIEKSSIKLIDISNASSGIKEYEVGKGNPSQTKETTILKPYNSNEKLSEYHRKHIKGNDILNYLVDWQGEYLNYGEWIAAPRNPIFFEGKRLIIREIPSKKGLVVAYTEENYTVKNTAHIFILNEDKSEFYFDILAILNSKLFGFYFKYKFAEFDDVFPKAKIGQCKELPISNKVFSSKTSILNELSCKLYSFLNNESKSNRKFLNYLSSQYKLEKLTGKLTNWYQLDFSDFIKELNKAIKTVKGTTLTKKEEFEWMELFEENKKKALELKTQIDQTDKEIDRMVYELYGLTEDEIQIVENS
jgi:type I restriction-modification system DNA methylase subunit